MSMRSVLVIGGAGFIGSALCQELTHRGIRVRSFDRAHREKRASNVEFVSGDFFKREDLLDALEGVDAVVHALGIVNPGNSDREFMRGYAGEFVQSALLFDECARRGVSVLFVSSGGTVYGRQTAMPISETALPSPINHYGALKLCIETSMRAFAQRNGVRMVAARDANPYGPGQDYRKGVGFIDACVRKTLAGEPIEIWGDGKIVRDYIHIDDVSRMLADLLDVEGGESVFNVSSGVGTSQLDVVGVLRECGFCPRVRMLPSRSVDTSTVVLDNSRIMAACGARELVGFRKGVKRYIAQMELAL